jgi:hypothetical protein
MVPKFKKDKRGFPDPLHIELPHNHKKLLELAYILAIIASMISIVLLNIVGVLNIGEKNASNMLLLVLGVLLVIFIVEKSLVHHKPEKSSS